MALNSKPLQALLPALVLLLAFPDFTFGSLHYQTTLPDDYDLALDTRVESECKKNSLANAVCVPPEHLIGDHNRLANFSGLFWLLGTAGLDGSEHVVIVGDKSTKRDFMAGWLYVAGQSRITVVDQPVSPLLTQSNSNQPGQSRSTTRTLVYGGQSRTQLLILKPELLELINSVDTPTLLDGRTESEYWGQTVIATRGGHIPGAMHLTDASAFNADSEKSMLAYARDSVSGLAYLARLKAANINAKLYLGGWAEWAADGTLPIDAAAYPTLRSVATTKSVDPAKSISASGNQADMKTTVAAMLVFALFLSSVAYLLGRKHGVKSEP